MLKRKILAAVLPVVAAATVVGSGFSAWYFNSISGYDSDTPVGTIITDEAKNGKGLFKVYYNSGDSSVGTELGDETVNLILDQGTGTDRVSNVEKGISFQTGTSKTAIKDLTFRYEIPAEDYNNLISAGLNLKCTFTISLNEKLANYVIIKSTATDSGILTSDNSWSPSQVPFTSNDEGKTFVSEVETMNMEQITAEGQSQTVVSYYYDYRITLETDIDQSNAFLKYKMYKATAQDGAEPITYNYEGKPENSEALQAMRNALVLIKAGINFNYSVTTNEG